MLHAATVQQQFINIVKLEQYKHTHVQTALKNESLTVEADSADNNNIHVQTLSCSGSSKTNVEDCNF